MTSPDVMIWRDGQRLEAIASDDRSLRYGDGLFETVRVVAGQPVLMPEHWARLSWGCQRLGLIDDLRWRTELGLFLQHRRDGIVRIHVSAGSGGRGYARPAQPQPVLILHWFDEPLAGPVQSVCISEARLRLAEQPALAGIKHANRLEHVLLRQELSAMPACQELLVSDQRGCVIEGVFSNIFFVRQHRLHTPELKRCGVRGVLRDALLARCAEQGIEVVIGDFTRADVLAADAVFFVNSVNGLWPASRWIANPSPANEADGISDGDANHDKTWRIDAITRQCQDVIAPWFANP